MPKVTKIFVACPIGADGSAERSRSDRLLKHVIIPIFQELAKQGTEAKVVRADQIAEPGRISRQIIEEIVSCEVMIADITGDNPNVMYEVGLRQALLLPYILMAEKGHKLPFDLADIRTVFYQLDLDTVENAQAELKSHLDRALKGEISAIDKDLLSRRAEHDGPGGTPAQDVQLLEASGKILQEVVGVRDLLASVAKVVVTISQREALEIQQKKEQMNQQVGMAVFQALLQSPEKLEKTLPALQKLMEFSQKFQPGSSTNETGTKTE